MSRASNARSSASVIVPTPFVKTIRSLDHWEMSSARSARSSLSPISSTGSSEFSQPSHSTQLCRLVP